MPEAKRPLKVFLCHASADKPKVRELYRYLKKRGIQPWLDVEDLLPGQSWQVEIPKAIEESDAILICLSKASVDKEGYVQKEIRFALDKALELPEGRIFIIPARLDECDVPRSLSTYHWVDLFDSGGYDRLMKSLKVRASQLQHTKVENTTSPNLIHRPKQDILDSVNVKIQLTTYEQPKENPNHQQVSVYVINNEHEDLTECVGTLISMSYHWPDGSTPTDYKEIIVLPRQLAWSSKTRPNDSHLITIKPGNNQKAIIDVARANNGEMIFTFATGDETNNRTEGFYEITLEIAGKINGHPFQPAQGHFLLHFRGGDALSITKIEDRKYYEDKGQATKSEPEPAEPISQKIQPKLKTEYIVAIIGAAATLIAALIGILPQFIKPAPAPTTTANITILSTHTATATFIVLHPSQTLSHSTTPTKFITFTPTPTSPPIEIIDAKDVPMRFVPAGGFIMGSEKKVHTIYMSAFYVDKYEISNALYKTCVEANICQPPFDFSSNAYSSYYGNPKFDSFPVIKINWDMAKTYCEWRTTQLPTEAQWEKAARGTNGLIYPWGNKYDDGCSKGNFGNCSNDLFEVNSFQSGVSPYGIFNMAGNASEWVADWYQDDYQFSILNNPLGPQLGTSRVVKGGSYQSHSNVTTYGRWWHEPQLGFEDLGFRCTRSVP